MYVCICLTYFVYTVRNKDYETQNYNAIFYPGETRHRLLLDLIDDDTVEDTEYYFLSISNTLPDGVSIARYNTTRITIYDDVGNYLLIV